MIAIGVAAASAACTAEVEDPRYGPPGGLRNVNLPAPQTSGTGTTPTPTGDGGGGGDGGVNPQNCTVKFSTDIFPMITGPWACTNAACHGPGSATKPSLDPQSAANTYTALTQDTQGGGKPFINAGKTDPNASAFLCVLAGTCGAAMPIPGGTSGATAATQAQITTVTTYLQCGAPNN